MQLFHNRQLGSSSDKNGYAKSFRELAKIVTQLEIQGGVLTFFCSYTNMELFECELKNCLGKTKLFVKNVMLISPKKYLRSTQTTSKKKRNAILLCVSRGNFSEGLNFKNQMDRACFIVAEPLLAIDNYKVEVK
jgi:Rad3-related DNA helicase